MNQNYAFHVTNHLPATKQYCIMKGLTEFNMLLLCQKRVYEDIKKMIKSLYYFKPTVTRVGKTKTKFNKRLNIKAVLKNNNEEMRRGPCV